MSQNYAEIEERIQNAYKEWEELEKPNIAKLARNFEVPEGRLRARIEGRQSRSERGAANRLLTESEELAICLYLKRLDTIGTAARVPMVTSCANLILQQRTGPTGLADNQTPIKVGRTWTARFLERHPEFYIRKQKTLDFKRKMAHNPSDLCQWFEQYKSTCDKNGIQSTDIYNFDETGFRIGIGKDQWIITQDPDRQSYLASSSNRELVTSCETIGGDGYVLPPMLILPGTIHLEDWVTKTNLDDNILIGLSETGYSNDRLALDWLKHFDKFTSKRQIGSHRLLLLDGYGSHCTKQFLDFCDKKNIIPFCLPSHTTHLLQPLDVVVFQPLKHYHAEAIEQATRTGCSDFNKIEFLAAIGSIREKAFKRSTIISAFKKTGLIPYNPCIVLSKLRERSPEPATYSLQSQSTQLSSRPSTPPSRHPELEPCLSTPQTVRSLKRHADFLWQTDPNTSTFRNSLNFYLKGSIAQAHLANQLQEDLDNAEAAQLARANRQKRTRRGVQRGGVLYASEARTMVERREENEAEKQIRQAEYQLRKLERAKASERKRIWNPIFKALKESVRRRNKRLKLRTETS